MQGRNVQQPARLGATSDGFKLVRAGSPPQAPSRSWVCRRKCLHQLYLSWIFAFKQVCKSRIFSPLQPSRRGSQQSVQVDQLFEECSNSCSCVDQIFPSNKGRAHFVFLFFFSRLKMARSREPYAVRFFLPSSMTHCQCCVIFFFLLLFFSQNEHARVVVGPSEFTLQISDAFFRAFRRVRVLFLSRQC